MWWTRDEEAVPPAKSPPPPQDVPTAMPATELSNPLPVLPTPQSMPDQMPRRPLQLRDADCRLSLPLHSRLPLSTAIAAVTGLLLGVAKGSQDANYRFRAENSHRLPRTQHGWFLYHKSKNYNIMLGGIQEGARQSIKFGAWTGLFFLLEEGVDRGRAAGRRVWGRFWGGEWKAGAREMRLAVSLREAADEEERAEEEIVRGSRDCVSSMLAGLGIAGMFSAWNRFPLPTAARTAKMGAKAGLAFGLLQDGVSLLRGRRVGYVEFVKGMMGGSGEGEKVPG